MKRTLLHSFFASTLVLTALTASAQQTWHGYYEPGQKLYEFGTGIPESYDCAIFLAGQEGLASGKSISKVRLTLPYVDQLSSLSVWVSKSLPQAAENADVEVHAVELSSLASDTPFEVELDRDFYLPEAGAYVGFSFTSADPYPLLTTAASTTVANAFFLKTTSSYPNWVDYTKYNAGNLPVEVLVNGTVYDNAAAVVTFPTQVALLGQNIQVPVTVRNLGTKGLTSIDYTLQSSGGETSGSYTLPTPLKVIQAETTLPLDLVAPSAPIHDAMTLRITRVNGQPNEIEDKNPPRGGIISINESARRVAVMEEFTGSWCGWCPRGAVAIEHLRQDLPGQFIGIAVHSNDAMEIEDYASMRGHVSGYPFAFVNRAMSGDPFFGTHTGPGNETSYGVFPEVKATLDELTCASLDLSAQWKDKEGYILQVKPSVTFQFDGSEAPGFNIAYVVTADSLMGDDYGWEQNNDYSLVMAQQWKDDPYLGWLCDKGSRLRGYKYNDVAIATHGTIAGLPLSIDGAWTAGQRLALPEFEIDLTGNELVQNRDNVKIVAMLIDPSSYRIINAAEAWASGNHAGMDEEMPDAASPRAYYDLYGRRITSPTHGVCIARHADGRVEKIYTK